jgi:methionyl-tRNA synthetase
MRAGLGVSNQGELATLAQWGGLQVGTAIAKPEPLFPRMEKKKGPDAPAASTPGKEKAKELEGVITFEDFGKVELRVAEIVAAEKVKKSDRLLKLTVRAPEERTIVAGIAEFYQPEELPGRRVIIVANLKPAKLMGITSQGMVLAAKDGDRLVLSSVAGEVAPGARVA